MKRIAYLMVLGGVILSASLSTAEAGSWVYFEASCGKSTGEQEALEKKVQIERDGIKVLDWSRYVLSEPSQKCGTAQKTVACYQVAEDQADRLRGLGLERAEHQCRKPRLRRGH